MAEYLVRTPKGDKGPFSLDHLEKLVAAGRLPASMAVIEVESGLAIPLGDLIAPGLVQSLTPEDPPPPEAAPAPAAPRPAAPRPAAPRPAAPKSRAPSARSSARPPRAQAPGGRPRPDAPPASHRQYAPKKSPVATIGLSVFVVILLIVGAWGLLRENPAEVIADYQARVTGNYTTSYTQMLPTTPDFAELSSEEQEVLLGTFREYEAAGGIVKVRVTAKRIKVSMEGETIADTPLEIVGRSGPDAFRVILEPVEGTKATGEIRLTSTGIIVGDRGDGGLQVEFRRLANP